jgi:hypothetical protein
VADQIHASGRPYARLLYHARTAGFPYQASLRARMTDALGVRFGEVEQGMAEAPGDRGPPRGRCVHSAKAAQVATLATRSPKIPPSGGAPDGLRGR